MNLVEYLLQQTDGGPPALIHRPTADVVDDDALDRLVEDGVLEFREHLTTWDPCDGCECGAMERAIRWIGDKPTAICAPDSSSDTQLPTASLEIYAIIPERLATAVARAAGLRGRPEPVLPAVWLLGRIAENRSLLLATSSKGLHVAGAIDRLRAVGREVNFTLIAAVGTVAEITDLADRRIEVVQPSDAFLPSEPGHLFRVNIAKLASPAVTAEPPLLRINVLGFTVEFHGAPVNLQPRDFRAFMILVREARDSGAAAQRDDLYHAICDHDDAEMPIGDEQVDKSISRIRQALCAAAGIATSEGRKIIVTIRGEGYRLTVPALRIQVD